MVKYLTPGPVQLPPRIIEAYAKQPMFHRGKEFSELYSDVINQLGRIFRGYTVSVLPGTGTFAVDVMVYNFIKPGDEVIVPINGEFGERLAQSVESRGAVVKRIYTEPGESICDHVEELNVKAKAIAMIHNETSMGVANRCISEVAKVIHDNGGILLIDSVSGVPAEPLNNDADVIATATHKALLAPPGGSIIAFKDPGLIVSYPKPPSMDLGNYLKYSARLETPYTPPINVLYALRESLRYILDEVGLEKYVAIHDEKIRLLYDELNDVGFKPVPVNPNDRSRTVTAFYSPVNPAKVIDYLRQNGYVISGGMWRIRERSIRIGVMGDVTLDDLRKVATLLKTLTANQP
ncbi:pyridoxal-phosphate-dependent aminotransferase family protein [Caldivirga sp.]|uniref:pyridoxal-phosphate-dependent aminotransferase family protein n=1 Tax=Caldivirga sp. TaxID=2080243 RepID=UPI003D0BB2E0